MAKILFIGTHGTEDPTRASLPFIGANGASEAGHQPIVALVGDAVSLMKQVVADSITPVGWPALKEHLATAIGHKTAIHV